MLRSDLLVRHQRTVHVTQNADNMPQSSADILPSLEIAPPSPSQRAERGGSEEVSTASHSLIQFELCETVGDAVLPVGPAHEGDADSTLPTEIPDCSEELMGPHPPSPSPPERPSTEIEPTQLQEAGIHEEGPRALYEDLMQPRSVAVSDNENQTLVPDLNPPPSSSLANSSDFHDFLPMSLDFFDPFLGLSSDQLQSFGPLPFTTFNDDFSPLELMQTSDADQAVERCTLEKQGTQSLSDHLEHSGSTNCRAHTQTCSSLTNSTVIQSILNPALGQSHQVRPIVPSFSDRAYGNLLQRCSMQLNSFGSEALSLPSSASVRKCLQTYVDAFHIHFLILHLPTMNLDNTSPALILAMCAIGALYRLERKISAPLYLLARQYLETRSSNPSDLPQRAQMLAEWELPQPSRPKVLEDISASQARLLLTIYASFSGHPKTVLEAFSELNLSLQVGFELYDVAQGI